LFYAGVLPTNYEMHANAGVVGVEMECSALFVIAALRRVKAGALLTMDGRPLRTDDYAPHGELVATGTKKMLEIGLEAAIDVDLTLSPPSHTT
jgi:uridine phosphorylase